MTDTIILISPEGDNLGNVTMETAQRIADERYGLDLVEVRQNVYKILDLGKLKYEASKRRQVKTKQTKEMKFKLNIGEADFKTKIGHVHKFLRAGHPVRVTIWFSGREVTRPEAGVAMMQRICDEIGELGTCSMNNELQGKNMFLSITPGVKK